MQGLLSAVEAGTYRCRLWKCECEQKEKLQTDVDKLN